MSKVRGGFIFKGGSVVGIGHAYLGRAYVPRGWNSWNFKNHESDFTYVEVECKGSESDRRQRVPWMKNLTNSQLEQFSLSSFINKDNWLSNFL
ncbi:putative pectinesterase [Lupinus albus]|uniref:pectinesterase n=1 Tax=Lupinus albus TaxID=3870 RepID=A0A6A4QUM5_LUPAL|nr:putative pectinesterase [Lupinus albus]